MSHATTGRAKGSSGPPATEHPPDRPTILEHFHHNGDEYSFVPEGTLGALPGDDVVTAGPGAWGDVERFAEISEKYALDVDPESVPGLCERFGLTFPEL